MDQLKITIKTSKLQKTFSESFKKQVVKEYDQGLLNKDQLQVKYGLRGNSTVLKWCRKYGRFIPNNQPPAGQ